MPNSLLTSTNNIDYGNRAVEDILYYQIPEVEV